MGVKLSAVCEWIRPVGVGFALGDSDGSPVLVTRPTARFEAWHVFREQPHLFRAFAQLDGSDASFVSFATEHGPLRVRVDEGHPFEPLADWRKLHADLAPRVQAWQHRLESIESVEVVVEGAVQMTTDPSGILAVLMDSARHFGPDLLRRVTIRPFAQIEFGVPTLGLFLYAPDLGTSLVLGFLLALLRGERHAQCEACGKWFDASPGSGRRDRRLCSDACRKRLHRRRQKGAA